MIPRALRIVAVLHLLSGIVSAVGTVLLLLQSHVYLDLGVLGIPIYYGLLRLSSGWRTCALVWLWLSMLTMPVVVLIAWLTNEPAPLRIFGLQLSALSPFSLTVLSIPMFLLALWQYRVLTRPDIRALFPTVTAAAPLR